MKGTFENCFNPKTKYLFKFDFYVDNKYIIEYDGQQHFQSSSGWNTEEKVKYNPKLLIPSTKRGHSLGETEKLVEQAVRTCTNVKNRQERTKETNITSWSFHKVNNWLKDILQDKYLVKNIDHYNLKKEL